MTVRSTSVAALDERSGHDAIMAEMRRLCEVAGDPDAAKFYAWSQQGLWRAPDRSESGPVDIGSNRVDMQEALDLDVASHVRLRRRREAIDDTGEPDWSLAIRNATRVLLVHAGSDPAVAIDRMEDAGIGPGGLRVDSVTHRRGCVLASIHVGVTDRGTVTYDAFEGRSELRISGFALPETVMAGIAGEPLRSVMPHALLDELDLHVADATTIPGWAGEGQDTILRLVDDWIPLVSHHTAPRPWLRPLPLPRYA